MTGKGDSAGSTLTANYASGTRAARWSSRASAFPSSRYTSRPGSSSPSSPCAAPPSRAGSCWPTAPRSARLTRTCRLPSAPQAAPSHSVHPDGGRRRHHDHRHADRRRNRQRVLTISAACGDRLLLTERNAMAAQWEEPAPTRQERIQPDKSARVLVIPAPAIACGADARHLRAAAPHRDRVVRGGGRHRPRLGTVKAWLATVAVLFAVVQVASSLVMYAGRFPGSPRRRGRHAAPRWSGRIAFIVTVPVAVHCLYALGFETFNLRVIVHSIAYCLFFGTFTVKMLALTRKGLPNWCWCSARPSSRCSPSYGSPRLLLFLDLWIPPMSGRGAAAGPGGLRYARCWPLPPCRGRGHPGLTAPPTTPTTADRRAAAVVVLTSQAAVAVPPPRAHGRREAPRPCAHHHRGGRGRRRQDHPRPERRRHAAGGGNVQGVSARSASPRAASSTRSPSGPSTARATAASSALQGRLGR